MLLHSSLPCRGFTDHRLSWDGVLTKQNIKLVKKLLMIKRSTIKLITKVIYFHSERSQYSLTTTSVEVILFAT